MRGRTAEEHELFIIKGQEFLINAANQQKDTSYTEMNAVLARRTGLRPFDFEHPEERDGMSGLLRDIALRELTNSDLLITVLVSYLNTNGPGAGFFTLAQETKKLTGKLTADRKLEFWTAHMNEVFGYYQAKGRKA